MVSRNVKGRLAFMAKSVFIIAVITEALFLKLALGEAVCGTGMIIRRSC